MPQSNEVVNLWTFFDEWTRCFSSTFQRDSLYRFGKFDSCSAQFDDLKLAIKAKMMSNEKEASELISTSFYKKNLGSDLKNSPTAGYIWEIKDKPGWEAS